MRTSGTRSCCLRKVKSPFELRGPLRIPLQSMQGHRASSRVEAGTSGCLSSSDMDLGVPMEFQQGSQASSHVETWKPPSRDFKEVSGFLSRQHRVLGLFLEVSPGCHTSLHVLSRSSGFQSSPCKGIRLLCSGWGNRGLFELRHDCWGCARVSRGDRTPPEGRRQRKDSFPGKAGELTLISIRGRGKTGLFLSGGVKLGVPL